MTRRIAAVTGSRAEYGLLKPVIEALSTREHTSCGFLVTGCHLQEEYGATVRDIKEEGVPLWAELPMYEELGGDFSPLAGALSKGLSALSRALQERRADIVVVLGDRVEALAGALAGFLNRIAVAHIHGGERTDGHLDDSIRHAITRLAHLHFPATQRSAERLAAMGEEPWRIHCCGAPGLDALRTLKVPEKTELAASFGLESSCDFIVVLFHAETAAWKEAGTQIRTILSAAAEEKRAILALYPNGDPGSALIVEALKEFSLQAQPGRFHLRQHLARHRFLQALSVADALVGNSSCGLIEASFTGTPVLHVGQRNRGREHGGNVLFVQCTSESVRKGLQTVLSEEFRTAARRAPCPWGDGHSGQKIACVLAEVPLGEKLLAKRLTL